MRCPGFPFPFQKMQGICKKLGKIYKRTDMSRDIVSKGETGKGGNIKKIKSARSEHSSTNGASIIVAKESHDKRRAKKMPACLGIK